jgi:hypothetical protein
MKWYQRIPFLFRRKPAPKSSTSAVAGDAIAEVLKELPPLKGRRQTPSEIAIAGRSARGYASFNRPWLATESDIANLQAPELSEFMADVSPEISKALWDSQRMCNPGMKYDCFIPGTLNEDPEGKALIDAFFERLKYLYGSVDVPINRLFLNAQLRGAFVVELVLDSDRRTPVDLATPDPSIFQFRVKADPVRGDVWELGYVPIGGAGGSQFISLDEIPTVKYVPIDPLPNRPFGRAPMAPALFSSTFLLGMLHDLRRVIMQQGYPRIDIKVDFAKLAARADEVTANNPTALQAYLKEKTDQIIDAYGTLEPDDAFVHDDAVEVVGSVGAVTTTTLGGIDAMIKAVERISVRALKTVPLLQSIDEATSEANANRQYEIYAAGIKSLQHYVENILEVLLELALRAQGRICKVHVRFAELRAAEMLRDAQTEMLRIQNAKDKRDEGWIDQNAASIEIAGKPPVLEEPIYRTLEREQMEAEKDSGTPNNASQKAMDNADPGADRRAKVLQMVLPVKG